MPAFSFPQTAEIAPDVYLDCRRALVHRKQGWMAIADVHFGFELHRLRQGALLPEWGMERCRQTMTALLEEYRPQKLILAGDIMDGAGSAAETACWLDELARQLEELVLIEGNHDRPALRKKRTFLPVHQHGNFLFQHGHQDIAPPSDGNGSLPSVLITGHHHPAVSVRDGAGLRLKLPALVRQGIGSAREHWILPAFSPWAAGGDFKNAGHPSAVWACAPGRVWQQA